MSKLYSSFDMAKDVNGYNQVVLGNGAVVKDSLEHGTKPLAIHLSTEAYYSYRGLGLLIEHLKQLQSKLSKESD